MRAVPTAMSRAPASAVEFEDLLVSHQEAILRYLKSQVGNHHEAEDLLQKTNLILWQKRGGFASGSNFRAWSFAIARREALSRLRQQRRDQRVFADARDHDLAVQIVRPAEDVSADPLIAMRDCLNKLPSRDQELLLMRYGTKRTLNEYAKQLNRSPGTLKARLFKIRENLRREVEDRLREIAGCAELGGLGR